MPQYPNDPYSLSPEDFTDFNQSQINPFSNFQDDGFLDSPENMLDFVAGEEAEDFTGSSAGGEFYANLAKFIDQKTLENLASEIIEGIDNDKSSRKDWEESLATITQYLGWIVEDFEDKLCRAYDNTLSITLMNFLAVIKGELLPPAGPTKGIVMGEITDFLKELSEKKSTFFNHVLTTVDRSYYPDKERLILYVGLYGIAFTKVVQDPSLKAPLPRFIKPQDLIINNECTSLLQSSRITQVIKIPKKEISIKERDGIYLLDTAKNSSNDDADFDSEINEVITRMDGITKGSNDTSKDKYLLDFYESHVDLAPSRLMDKLGIANIEAEGGVNDIPRPYIVEICKSTKKIASIKRNWREGDSNFKRIECFVPWRFMPGLGLYSNGLGQLLGNNSVVMTNALRQVVDSISFGNFPGGFIRKGCVPDENNITVHPGQFIVTDTNETPTSEVYSTLPFPAPSTVGLELIGQIKSDTSMLGGAAQQASPLGSSEAPVGTTLANIEINDRFPSNILQSFIGSFNYEMELMNNAFKEYFDEPYRFDVPGKSYEISREDFDANINIVSAADPNLSTKSQRIVINETIIRIARENPGTIDLKEAVRGLLQSMNTDNLEKLMPASQEILPMDPVTENMNIINGKGVKAGLHQDDDAHITSHSILFQNPVVAQDPQKMAVAQAHIAEHTANKYLKEMQMAMGMQMPDEQALQDPQVQNQIAMMAAEAVQKQQQEQQAQNPPPPNPTEVMMEDIKQKRESSLLKHQEAELRAETEAFKVQTQFESDQAKMEIEKELAREKNETSLAIAKMKQN